MDDKRAGECRTGHYAPAVSFRASAGSKLVLHWHGRPRLPHDRNPFLSYLNSHPGSDAVALKQLFRMLAKRTHPDLVAENEAAFVKLQDAYNEAVAELIRRQENIRARQDDVRKSGDSEIWLPSTARERVLHFLYRYKAHLATMSLEAGPVPPACHRAFDNAMEAASNYTDDCRYALEQFHEQFHTNRRVVARFPEVTTKYRILIQGFASVFDYFAMPNRFTLRLISSYLSEIKPVTDFDPGAGPQVRSNRSAAARSALYRMRTWLESEVDAGPCRIL